jgi:hypothetical protein
MSYAMTPPLLFINEDQTSFVQHNKGSLASFEVMLEDMVNEVTLVGSTTFSRYEQFTRKSSNPL